jgi:hypothetical protein
MEDRSSESMDRFTELSGDWEKGWKINAKSNLLYADKPGWLF